jgi:hypothetical protein
MESITLYVIILGLLFTVFLIVINAKTYNKKKTAKVTLYKVIKSYAFFELYSSIFSLVFGILIPATLLILLFTKAPFIIAFPILAIEFGIFIFFLVKSLNRTVGTLPVSSVVEKILRVGFILAVGYILFLFLQVIVIMFPK